MILNALRNGVGNMIACAEKLTRPAAKKRNSEEQAKVDQAAAQLALYQFNACPFCIKVRRRLHVLNVPVPLVEVKRGNAAEQQLINQGGKRQVPCLYIKEESGAERWLYESDSILDYLQQRFA